ncbi:hypothetical protein C4K46_02150 [Streptococcus oricebi]|uniref:Lipoprotein n=2 Tax=Streptococcus oricebi TaxID=1547447 RepID=A0ABS5B1M4_9STRE|nr:hypothetical protein [Streptococcus oricebi]
MMLGLSGCRYLGERKFSDLEKVYPTRNAYDLFKVFPKGFHILNTQEFDEKTIYYLSLDGNASAQSISGELEITEDNQKVEEVEIEVKKTGELVANKPLSEKYQDFLDKFQFLFQLFDLKQNQLGSFRSNDTWDNANGDYIRFYKINDVKVANYLETGGQELSLGVQGNTSDDKEHDYSRIVDIGWNNKNIREFIFDKGEK